MKVFAIGIIAATLCTSSFLPQVLRIFKTKHTKDISLVTFSLFSTGVFLWMIYGILINDMVIILANALTFIFAIAIVAMKIKYG